MFTSSYIGLLIFNQIIDFFVIPIVLFVPVVVYFNIFVGRALPLYTTMFVSQLDSPEQKKVKATSIEAKLAPGGCKVQYKQMYMCTHCLVPVAVIFT